MTQKGPTEVPSPITAPSSIRAVGSIVLIQWSNAPSVNMLDFPLVSAACGTCPVTYGYTLLRAAPTQQRISPGQRKSPGRCRGFGSIRKAAGSVLGDDRSSPVEAVDQ